MRTLTITISLFLLTISCWSKAKYLGVVKLNFYEEYEFHEDSFKNMVSDTMTFEFYNDIRTEQPANILSVYSIIKGQPIKTILNRTKLDWFSPMIFEEEGDYLVFRTCIEIKGNWMKVVVNENDNATLWIKKSKYANFISWGKLYKDSFFLYKYDKSKHLSNPRHHFEKIRTS